MSDFIFQSRPDRFDLRTELAPGRKETWYATRYRRLMKPGDVVLFWMSGDEDVRGLYGWGELTSEAYQKPNWDDFGVDLICKVRFRRPILATTIRRDPKLRDLLIFRAPQATNFLIDEAQVSRALRKLIEDSGEQAPSLGAGA